MTTELIPIGNRIIVKLEEEPTETKGGLVISLLARHNTVWGEVIAIGQAVKWSETGSLRTHIKVGDKVLFSRLAGFEIEDEGQAFTLISDSDVWLRKKREAAPEPSFVMPEII